MTLNVDDEAVSRHVRHLNATYKTASLPWELANIGTLEALHIVAARYDRKFAADLFRELADRLEQHHRSSAL